LIMAFNGEIRRLSLDLRRMAGLDEDVRLLMTIPGIGYYTALLVKAEVGDVRRFKSGDHLCSYARIVPSIHSSGDITRHGGITREGSRWLRWAMVKAAMTHIRYDTSITRAYHRIAEKRGSQVAIVATAPRLLLCCYMVLKDTRPYRPFHGQAFKTLVNTLSLNGTFMRLGRPGCGAIMPLLGRIGA